ncbi:MaoC family dehydratase [Candidatus Fermentibacteria bacterium]|jgi:acyl dehydratase|nr:MAG: MaoC family dehydratase [Candidatus Fermentibacteria bacterium]
MSSKIVIASHADVEKYDGREVGRSPWKKITQDTINAFADATSDHQWIHVDPERAAASPFGATIAHGFLTVSLLPALLDEIIEVRNSEMTVNYAVENLRFGTPVLVNSEVRLILTVNGLRNLRGITRVTLGVEMEIKGEKRPAYKGSIILLYHFR